MSKELSLSQVFSNSLRLKRRAPAIGIIENMQCLDRNEVGSSRIPSPYLHAGQSRDEAIDLFDPFTLPCLHSPEELLA
ncbi:hypothetical protein EVAR_47735_1 [Eumeta japonica]|uniref:Uncharacterized protein n=1 Tax=Eumeta variegata TaxID=151549 RepID=A0A4C1VUM3_EUMVA|nr:hypothetical protein EVAR_47735_1 [Eumeta japonica]